MSIFTIGEFGSAFLDAVRSVSGINTVYFVYLGQELRPQAAEHRHMERRREVKKARAEARGKVWIEST
jgi:hypothetical protein